MVARRVLRVGQRCKHFVGEELKLEVQGAEGRMTNVHLIAGESSLEPKMICAQLWGCYFTTLLEKGQPEIREGL